ncbi:chordin, partial [Clupea harengus]|uniref:Chordin n=1 Tax=Clupea harengus TaxID=7950 RepID=A0A8M1KMW7_CLUHA
LQSVMSSGEALTPAKTGAVGSAIFHLHDNGTLDYQVQVVGVASKVIGVTLELKPRRRSKRSMLYELMEGWGAEPGVGGGRGQGSVGRLEARHIHMLLQNELFVNVATETHADGEVRGQVVSLLYNGLEAHKHEMPVPLAGQLVSPPISTSAGGHAWLALDERCHLHYEILVSGLSRSDDLSVNAHLHGLAEIGEMDESSTNQRRLLTGFYGSQAEGVLRDLSVDLLRHLDQGTAFIQISTKLNPSGEIRGQVHVPNSCEFGSRGDVVEEAEFDDLVFVRDPEELRKDPLTCFFEGEHHTHGSHWTPQYNACFNCSCQKRTVICDPVICPALSCPHTRQTEDKCCPVCDERKDIGAPEKAEENPEGCYFEGDQKMHAPGTSWHPFVPPFGYIKCAVCTCKGSTGEVHCEKVTCPLLTCSRPIRRNPTDCCKACPAEAPPQEEELMQGDGPRSCKFGRSFYQHSERWHPRVPLVGEVKCITCWCDHGVTKCQRKQCPVLSCTNVVHPDGKCCPECEGALSKEEEEALAKVPDKRKSWRH